MARLSHIFGDGLSGWHQMAVLLFLIWQQCVAGSKTDLSNFYAASCLVAIKTEARPSSTSSPSFITIYKYTEIVFFFFSKLQWNYF